MNTENGTESRIRSWADFRNWFVQTHQGPELDRETPTILAVAAVLLTVFYYFGRSGFFLNSGLQPIVLSYMPEAWHEYADLLPFVWWGFNSLFMRVVIPCALLWWLFRKPPSDYGLRLQGTLPHLPIYAGLYLFMLPFLVLASTMPSFQNTYPFYDRAHEGLDHFLLFELSYGLQFLGVEFFFRGFLIFALFKRFGWYSLLISAIPYVMIHFNKPIAETLGALLAGTLLGILAVRSRSVLPGVALHWAVAITMDLLAISQRLAD